VNMKHVVCNKNVSHILKFNTEKCFESLVDRLGKMVCLMCSQVTVGIVNIMCSQVTVGIVNTSM
jgi:hypothetical protein